MKRYVAWYCCACCKWCAWPHEYPPPDHLLKGRLWAYKKAVT